MPDAQVFASNPWLWVYLPLVGALGALGVLAVSRQLRRLRARRAARVERVEAIEAVASDGPLDDASQAARGRALNSIEQYFRHSRRVLVPSILLFTVIGLAVPFVDEVPAAFLSLFAGAITVIIGIAARAVLENMLAGLVLTVSKAVNIGDTVMLEGHYGTVEEISMTHTTIKIWDWRRYVVPNRRMLDVELVNYTLNDRYQWSQIEFWVAYDADMALVERLAVEAPRSSAAYAPYEAPRFWVMELAPHGVRCLVAAWADGPAQGWDLKHDTRMALIAAFAEHGIASHTWTVGTEHRMGPDGSPPARPGAAQSSPSRRQPTHLA